MTDWKPHADAAIRDITSALTGPAENAAAALDDALSNLNRAIDELQDEETPELESESDADRLEENDD